MDFSGTFNLRSCGYGHGLRLLAILSLLLLLLLNQAAMGLESEQHFKLLSSVEYTGKTQFSSQAETLFKVQKEYISLGRVRYILSTNDFAMPLPADVNAAGRSAGMEMSFTVDAGTKRLSVQQGDLALLEKVNNQCVQSLGKLTRDNIGQTWQQHFELFGVGSFPAELEFTLTAIGVSTESHGQMVAVRAVSKPFELKLPTAEGNSGLVKCTINAMYLFDLSIEDIYMSISVFEAETDMSGFKETLRHEIATYKTDATGVCADLTGLGKEFEQFIRKVGLSRKTVKVVEQAPLPEWTRSDGLRAAQIANIAAALACEGAPNPVAMVCVPAAQTIAMQSYGALVTAGQIGTVSSLLASSVPALGGMKIAMAPAFMGVGAGTAGAVAGGTAGAVAVAGGSSGSSRSSVQSPTSP